MTLLFRRGPIWTMDIFLDTSQWIYLPIFPINNILPQLVHRTIVHGLRHNFNTGHAQRILWTCVNQANDIIIITKGH